MSFPFRSSRAGLLRFAVGMAMIGTCAEPADAAEPETATLAYNVTAEGAACPDEESFRHKVAARLGYDPFVGSGKHRVVLEVRPGKQLRARAEVSRAGDVTPRVRELVGSAHDCEALVEALATTVAIAVDPARGLAPAPIAAPPLPPPLPPPDKPIERTASEQAPTHAPTVAPAPAPPIRLFALAGGLVSVGIAPGVALGAEAGFGARREALSLELSARIETMPEAVRVASGDRLEATVLSTTLAPCGQLGIFVGCAFGRVGAFQGRAPDVVVPSLGTTVFGAAGLRAGLRVRVWHVIAVQALVEGGLPIVRTSLVIGSERVWTAPPAFGGAVLSAVVLFP